MTINIRTHRRKLLNNLVKRGGFMAAKHVHLLIDGDVQGVGYRYFARSVANKHNLTGFVKNLPDGKVEAALEGEQENIVKAVDELRRGPHSGTVSSIDMQWKDPTSFYASFNITF